MICTIQWYKYF